MGEDFLVEFESRINFMARRTIIAGRVLYVRNSRQGQFIDGKRIVGGDSWREKTVAGKSMSKGPVD